MNPSVSSANPLLSQALILLSRLPTWESILNEIGVRSPGRLHILVEFGKPDDSHELGQTNWVEKTDISNSVIDFTKPYRDSRIPEKVWPPADEWQRVFQGKRVNPGATVYLIRVTQGPGVYKLAETIAHEIGAHVRGRVLGVCNDHAEWGSFAQGSATPGSLAQKILDELKFAGKSATLPEANPRSTQPGLKPPGEAGSPPATAGGQGGWFPISASDYDQEKRLNSGRVEVRIYVDGAGNRYYWQRNIYAR